MKKPWYLRKSTWIITIVITLMIPIMINEAYKCDAIRYVTEWEAADVIAFYGSFLSFLGSAVLGLVAIEQSRKANRVAERMLDIEQQREIPVLDVLEIFENADTIEKGVFRNALCLTLGDDFYSIDDQNELLDWSTTNVVVFVLKNISETHIISMGVTDVTTTTVFNNEKSITKRAKSISWSGGIRVFGSNDSQYIVIGGADFQYPPGLSTDELFEQCYYNPSTILEFCFSLKNAKGHTYEEKIKIRFTYLPDASGINFPCLLEKEIVSILPVQTAG